MSLIPLLAVAVVSLLIARIASVSLPLTGLP